MDTFREIERQARRMEAQARRRGRPITAADVDKAMTRHPTRPHAALEAAVNTLLAQMWPAVAAPVPGRR